MGASAVPRLLLLAACCVAARSAALTRCGWESEGAQGELVVEVFSGAMVAVRARRVGGLAVEAAASDCAANWSVDCAEDCAEDCAADCAEDCAEDCG